MDKIIHSFIHSSGSTLVSKYPDLMSKPFKSYESRLCPNNKDANTELYPQTPKHSPPWHLKKTQQQKTVRLISES